MALGSHHGRLRGCHRGSRVELVASTAECARGTARRGTRRGGAGRFIHLRPARAGVGARGPGAHGPAAKAALVERLVPAEVALEPVEQDQYGRMVAVVYQDDENVNAWLVHQGHAWVYRQYARDPRYCEAELAARGARRGVWARPAAEQRAPWEWRAVKRNRRVGYSDYAGETLERCVAALGKRPEAVAPLPLADAPAASASDGAAGECRIKGNIGGSGKIYHVPGTAAYAKTKIDESKGERWFCTEEEARTAGWRKPRG